MFKDMAFYLFGHEIDPFFQLFIFEPIIITIIAVLVAMVTKKAWTMALVIILLNIIDNVIDVNFLFGDQGIGTIITQNIAFFFSNFFSMFYEFVFSFLLAGLPFMHKKFGIA
ncbi:hypothetical protein ERX37_00715 [Macrococcus hajekii]|uniref:Uncharacterized protein n=1 Tax=Macrococcus hajekii TaxID=198482 RepID=A0A4R6BLY0_9STAP|nr:hypothetical protein [Macrococcus hajekii]TDM02642.1 hypothetical protein ERX37_00715 [Macrococcus hajekii]GGB02710.1 hypothetical protein GCM10007190_08360 [Macrococcus hajekii]